MIKVELVNAEELKLFPPEKIIGEFAAVCYDTDLEKVKPENIAKHVIESGHSSPQSAVSFRFAITGISRVESHQHVRHNVGIRHNQRSQRYVDEEQFDYVIPQSISSNTQAWSAFNSLMGKIQGVYEGLIALGIPLEDARYVLPNATKTALNTVMTYEALIHFCHVRLCTRAQWEIRQVAHLMVEEVEKVSPMLAKYLVPKCEYEGYCREGKKCCGRRPTKEEVFAVYNAQKQQKGS